MTFSVFISSYHGYITSKQATGSSIWFFLQEQSPISIEPKYRARKSPLYCYHGDLPAD
jgi:hypothetical protein